MSGSPTAGYAGALGMDPYGAFLYTAVGGNISAFTVHATTGVPSLIGTIAGSGGTTKSSMAVVSY